MHRSKKVFRDQDFLDLQVLANLAWFHPLAPMPEELRRKGRGFKEEDKATVMAATREILAKVLPRWKAMDGRVELCVSPYYHPIVPLLCDFASAREAIPGLPLPEAPSLQPEAEIQVRRAMEAGERHFGRKPRGTWPSEGSVSNEACAIFRAAGFEWAATDEAIIGEPGVKMLRGLKIAFRDTALSNLLGFTYKGMEPEEAARDFVRRLEGREGPVPVILDGENPWEHYPGGGVAFLRALFRILSNHPTIRTVTMSEIEPRGELGGIVAGSWINRNFGVWIGHSEDRRGWELLGRAYRDLQGSTNALAWECLRAAEGSDWYWWFGEDFTSAQDLEFDALFRRHLTNVYRALGRPAPEDLQRPIKQIRNDGRATLPQALLTVRLDGRRTDYFEWVAAGHYGMSREYSAQAGESSFISDVYYGFDRDRMLVRLDFKNGVNPAEALAGGKLRIQVTRPRAVTAPLEGVVGEIFEAAVPFDELGLVRGEDVEFFIEFERSAGVPMRIPSLMPLRFQVPVADFDRINWQV